MPTLVQELLDRISVLDRAPIRSFLLAHLNGDARTPWQLWNDKPKKFPLLISGCSSEVNGIPQKASAILLAFKFGPLVFKQALLDLLLQQPSATLISLLAQPVQEDNQWMAGPFAILDVLPDALRVQISEWVSRLSAENIFQYFTKYNAHAVRLKSQQIASLMSLRLLRGQALQLSMQALQKLSVSQRFSLLQAGTLMDVLVQDNLAEACRDELAEQIIRWIEPLSVEQKRTLLLGDADVWTDSVSILPGSDAKNLLHRVFQFSTTCFTLILSELNQFPDRFVRQLLLRLATRTPGHLVGSPFFELLNRYGATATDTRKVHLMIQHVLASDERRKLICEPLFETSSSLLERWVKHNQKELIAFVLHSLLLLNQYLQVFVLIEQQAEHLGFLEIRNLCRAYLLYFAQEPDFHPDLHLLPFFEGRTLVHYVFETNQTDILQKMIVHTPKVFIVVPNAFLRLYRSANYVFVHTVLSRLSLQISNEIWVQLLEHFWETDSCLEQKKRALEQSWEKLVRSDKRWTWLELANKSENVQLRLLIAITQYSVTRESAHFYSILSVFLEKLLSSEDLIASLSLRILAMGFCFRLGWRVFALLPLQEGVLQTRLRQVWFQGILWPFLLQTMDPRDYESLVRFWGATEFHWQCVRHYFTADGFLVLPAPFARQMARFTNAADLYQLWQTTRCPEIYWLLISRHAELPSVEQTRLKAALETEFTALLQTPCVFRYIFEANPEAMVLGMKSCLHWNVVSERSLNLISPWCFPSLPAAEGRAIVNIIMERLDDPMETETQRSYYAWMLMMCAEWYLPGYQQGHAEGLPHRKCVGMALIGEQIDFSLVNEMVVPWIEDWCYVLQTDSASAGEMVMVLVSFLSKLSQEQSGRVIQYLSPHQETLIERTLIGLQSDHYQEHQACQVLFKWLLNHAISHADLFELMKQKLGAQAMYLFSSEKLVQIAETILKKTLSSVATSLENVTYHCIWVQRLLVAPLFVGKIDMATLLRLIARYQAYSLLLKREQYEKVKQTLTYSRFQFSHHHALEESTSYWSKRAQRLLTFRAEDATRALLLQLEDACLQDADKVVSASALGTLYQYYDQQLQLVRNDLLFQFSNWLYRHLFQKVGDIRLAKSRILTWLNNHLPHVYLYQEARLEQGRRVLRNAERQIVGHVEESRYAMSTDSVNLSERLPIGTMFYDASGQVMGQLAEDGLFQSASILQGHTAAQLLKMIPLADLAQHPDSLNLLVAQLLQEKGLAVFYATIEEITPERRVLIEKALMELWVAHSNRYSIATLKQLVAYLLPMHIQSWLRQYPLKLAELQEMLSHYFSDDRVRHFLLFEWRHDIAQALERADSSDKYLRTYLLEHRAKSWFISGLAMLLQRSPLRRLVLQFEHLQDLVELGELTIEQFYEAVSCIVQQETGAKICLEWLDSSNDMQHKQQWLSFCAKPVVIDLLSRQKEESFASRHALLLKILQQEHARLFKRQEIRLSEQIAWQASDLKLLVNFLHRPIATTTDIPCFLLAEMTLRCANFGVMEFCFDETNQVHVDRLSTWVSCEQLVRVDQQDDNEGYRQSYETLRTEGELACINWQELAEKTTQALSVNGEVSILQAFLWNYDGCAQKLHQVLYRYATAVLQIGGRIDLLTQFIVRFPKHQVSQVICQAVVDAFSQAPYRLDRAYLDDLLQTRLLGTSDLLEWVKRLGAQKHYRLIQRCCQFLPSHVWTQKRHEILKILTEAKIEHSLLSKVRKWYFELYAFFKRIWHYGLSVTGYVRFAEELPSENDKTSMTAQIKGSWLGGVHVTEALAAANRHRCLKQLRTRILNSSGAKTGMTFFERGRNDPAAERPAQELQAL